MGLSRRSHVVTSPGTWISPLNSERRKTRTFSSDRERLRSFGTAIDVLREEMDSGFRAHPHASRDGTAYLRARGYLAQVTRQRNVTLMGALRLLRFRKGPMIEQRLFPELAREQARLVAPHLRAICREHGVPYRTGEPWSTAVRKYGALLNRLAKMRQR
jgi:hypothetical protein